MHKKNKQKTKITKTYTEGYQKSKILPTMYKNMPEKYNAIRMPQNITKEVFSQ